MPILPDPNLDESLTKGFGRHGIGAYEGHLYWPYGGTGFFISAALVERIQANNDGWEVCRDMFQASNTDIQVRGFLVLEGDFGGRRDYYAPLLPYSVESPSRSSASPVVEGWLSLLMAPSWGRKLSLKSHPLGPAHPPLVRSSRSG